MILDLGLPDLDGQNVIAALRGWTQVPIIVLSGRSDQHQKTRALDAGADDYVTKPFGVEELFARIRAVSRRSGGGRPPIVQVGQWSVDLESHRIRHGADTAADLHLTPTEWKILEVLVTQPGRLVTRAQLLRAVWGTDFDPETSSLRLYIAQLRRKLEPVLAQPRLDPHRGRPWISVRDPRLSRGSSTACSGRSVSAVPVTVLTTHLMEAR